MILIATPVEDGLIGTSSNETLATLFSTSQRFVIELSIYVQKQPRSSNAKREKVDLIVFLFTMDTGSCVVAKLPTGIAGPPRLTTNFEVATMTYCKADLHTCLLEDAVDMLTDVVFRIV